MSPTSPTFPPPPPEGSGVRTAIVYGALAALLGANIFLYVQINKLDTAQVKLRDTILTELTNLREASSMTTVAQKKHLDILKDELEGTRAQSLAATQQAKQEAFRQTAQVEQKLSAEQHKQQAAQQVAQQQTNTEIEQVKQVATTATTKIGEVSGEVGTVKADFASTKSELDKTIASLKSVVGDVGVQSGLIATNAGELSALRKLGERNYFEFTLGKTKGPQKVGDVMLQLKKTDPKKNKYTLEITADDKRTEKKDKSLNEPVQFYTSKARQPYELVVNKVNKDQIVGYLATPKVQVGR